MRRVWLTLDLLFLAIGVVLLVLLVQGYVKGGWLGRVTYANLGEDAWRQRMYVLTWRRDAFELHIDRLDLRLLADGDCDGCGDALGKNRWEAHFTIARLREPHARDGWRHVSVGSRARQPDPAEREVTVWMPHWLPVALLALPFTVNTFIRRSARARREAATLA